ncbi:diguanylate cyclase [Sphingobium sp. SCG-1]|uniref:putative bifunctional diguanylate cyclase/phosphodiesterase n=1 Tax=Sphingobium sp. SCG-1 TaxID=2072936 RepID=UPI000CD6A71B|nr:GGDEF domain-containing protein [Sphingobium sp. SCG-1]AUW60135.1 diguanylate cyclase [Sphingobium sp. SCG-1]
MIAKGEPLSATARQLCLEFELVFPEIVCTVLAVDRAGLLHPIAAPSLPEEFSASLEGVFIGPDVGSCGTAAYLGVPIAADDIEHDPRWSKYRGLVMSVGLRACWSSPVKDEDGATIGVVALYFREVRGPDDKERAVMSTSIELCEMALSRHARVVDRERRASVDALTSLPNRAAFNAAMARVPCEDVGSWALLVVDLDNLKVVNDTFGHQAGDGLIRVAAQRISRAMMPDVTFRVGGDEFSVIVQAHASLADLDATAARIFDALEAPADCDGHMVVPKATIGGAVLSPGDASAMAVSQNADFALYHAKETGRGGFVRYWPGIGTRITHRRDAIRDVTAALRDGRIEAYYQPIVRLDSREIVGVEALCRMISEAGEVVAAKNFQTATSDVHVATALTSRMLSIVASDVRRWLDEGLSFGHVSVNVSTADFYAGNLGSKLRESFVEAGVPLSHLILEVNEDVYVGQRDRVVAREIKTLRESGLLVALDDFGTGFASLTHLLTVPVDIIKIDQSFVARLWPDDASLVVVEGVIDIATKLGIRVVAEGIETEVQASQLWAMGCKLGQGFGFSRAVGRSAMTRLLQLHSQGAGAVPLYPHHAPREDHSADGRKWSTATG